MAVSKSSGSILVALCVAGCMTVPVSTSLGEPRIASTTVGARAWLKPVEISDPMFTGDRALASSSLTVGIERFLRDGRYFERVASLPGKPAEEDVVLAFNIFEYRSDVRPHPAYFPGAFLTLTLYIWVGLPVQVVEQRLSGSLRVEAANGSVVVPAISTDYRSKSTTTIYDPFSSGIDGRTRFIQDLVDKAFQELRSAEGS